MILRYHHLTRQLAVFRAMTGLAVADVLRRTSPGTKVLLMSGDAEVGRSHPAFLPKPFNRSEFLSAVTTLLEP